MKTAEKKIVTVLLVFSCILLIDNCKSTSNSNSTDPKVPDAYTETVGADGATVSDPRGGRVIIPPGALSGNTEISITTYSESEMKQNFTIAPFKSCVAFGSDGTVFNKPVTLVIPVSGGTAGASYPVFVYNPDSGAWNEHTSPGTGSADGSSIEVPTTHFSVYAGYASSGGGMRTFGSSLAGSLDASLAYDSLKAAFEGMIGMQAAWDNKTYEVTGLLFDVQYSINGNEGQNHDLAGDMASTTTELTFSYDYAVSGGSGPLVDNQVIYAIQITVYWKEIQGESWIGTMTYTKHVGNSSYTWDASYDVSFNMVVDPSGFSVEGTGTASQTASVSGTDDNWVENVVVTPVFDLLVMGYIYEDETMDIHFGISFEDPRPPFFTFDLFIPNDDSVDEYAETGEDLLSIYGMNNNHHFATPFTLREGTQSGSYTSGRWSYSFTITFNRVN